MSKLDPRWSVGMLLAGVAAGLGLPVVLPVPAMATLLTITSVIGGAWVTALKWVVVPLVITLLVTAIARPEGKSAGRTVSVTVIAALLLLSIAAILTLLSGYLVLTAMPLSGTTRSAFAVLTPPPAAESESLFNRVTGASPPLLPLLVLSLLASFVLRVLPAGMKRRLLDPLERVRDLAMRLSGWLLVVMPIAVFALVLGSTHRSGAELLVGLVYYIGWVSMLLLLGVGLVYAAVWLIAGIPVPRFARAIWPAQLLAFASRSSVACLPVMVEAVDGRLQLDRQRSAISLPLLVSTFKLNMGISAVFQMLFLLHVYDLQPGLGALVLATTLLAGQSLITPGLPSGAIWTTTPVYLGLGIPMEGIVLTNTVDTIPDLFKTTLNVTGNVGVAAIADRHG